eukprot:scaffold244280_cov15-Tisochrysis_lutea.AAC.1
MKEKEVKREELTVEYEKRELTGLSRLESRAAIGLHITDLDYIKRSTHWKYVFSDGTESKQPSEATHLHTLVLQVAKKVKELAVAAGAPPAPAPAPEPAPAPMLQQ